MTVLLPNIQFFEVNPMSTKPFTTQLQDEINYDHSAMSRKYLVKDNKRQAMLICFHAGIHIPDHTSSYDGFITVLEGRGVFRLAEREITLEPGVFIELPANTLHGLTVSENLAMLKVVDRHEAKEPAIRLKSSSCQDAESNQLRKGTCAESLVEMLQPFLQNTAMSALSVTEILQDGADIHE
jgi:quercetin dioxygenase-like cupin family protein